MTHGFHVFAFALVVCFHAAAQKPNAESLGIAALQGTDACVAFPGAELSTPQSVRIVVDGAPQRLVTGTVTSQIAQPCRALENALVSGPYYSLQLDPGNDLSLDIGIVLPARTWAVAMRGRGAVATGRGRKNVTFRSCTGNEGVHLTAWSGDPLKGRRIWHEYFYLGYDVEPSCEPRDYE
jgi:hypothetical protein